jgi:hypothetical protein
VKKLILVIFLSFFISSVSYSQFLGNSVFKNYEKLNLDKIIQLDITKYKLDDVKKLFGEDFFTEKTGDRSEYYIFLISDVAKYKLRLYEINNSVSLFLDLVGFDIVNKKFTAFQSCTELKNNYEKQYGNNVRYQKSDTYEKLEFQINHKNHSTLVFCQYLYKEVLNIYLFNENKKKVKVMNEVIKITCTLNKHRFEHLWSEGTNDDYMKIKDLKKKETLNLYIDEYRNTIGRVQDFNFDILGEYKVFSKDRIQVVEKKVGGGIIIWTLNRVNGDIDIYHEFDSVLSKDILDLKAKSTMYGNCQKIKGNVF